MIRFGGSSGDPDRNTKGLSPLDHRRSMTQSPDSSSLEGSPSEVSPSSGASSPSSGLSQGVLPVLVSSHQMQAAELPVGGQGRDQACQAFPPRPRTAAA